MALLLAVMLLAHCSKPVVRYPNIVLICVDTLRADHLSVYGYSRSTTPQIDRYFANARVYERAYTAATFTPASIVSILSGVSPQRHGVRDFYSKLPTNFPLLPDLLSGLGYQTSAIVSNMVLTDEALGLAAHFDTYDDFVDEREGRRKLYERRASRTTDAALKWLALERDSRKPHFLLLHYIDPHPPYSPPENNVARGFDHEGEFPLPEDIQDGYQGLPGITDGLTYVDRYDEEIVYADREIGRFLAAYRGQGLLEDAILIFLSDHGETLLEHDPYFEHSTKIWQEVVRVPLFMRWPKGEAAKVSVPVSLIDVTPSLLAYLKRPIPKDMEGVPVDERSPDDFLYQETWHSTRRKNPNPRQHAGIRGGDKWTFAVGPDWQLQEAWYVNVDADPHEKSHTAWRPEDDQVRAAIQKKLDSDSAFQASQPLARGPRGSLLKAPKVAPRLNADQLDALRALGYAE